MTMRDFSLLGYMASGALCALWLGPAAIGVVMGVKWWKGWRMAMRDGWWVLGVMGPLAVAQIGQLGTQGQHGGVRDAE